MYSIPIWKKSPFLRLLLPLMAGIILQWYGQLPVLSCWYVLGLSFIGFVTFFFIPYFKRYKLIFLSGIFATTLFLSLGALLIWHRDIRHDENWFGNNYHANVGLVATMEEPLVEKTKSFKANATVNFILENEKKIPVHGKIILYFKRKLAMNTQTPF